MPLSPLSRFKMLDLSRQLPGPFCSTLLGDLGADVLVIANPGDRMGVGIPFLGRNKRSMTLNLKSEEGRAIFHRLAAEADVVLEGARPGVTARLGIDYAPLSAENPRLVYCSISGYGQDGPYRDKVGHDVNYIGYAGVLNYIGEAGGAPVIPGVQIADIGGGALMAVVGILAALIARDTTGRGQLVDVSMMDSMVSWNVYSMVLQLFSGQAPARGGEQLSGKYPCYAVYQTKDGRHVTVGAYETHFWATLCRALGREDYIAQQWAEGEALEEMFDFFRAEFRKRTLAECMRELGDQDICFGPVSTLDEVYRDPQIKHRRMIVDVSTASGPMRMTGVPIKLSDTPGSIRTPPPAFGEHTDGVLGSLGYTSSEIERLRTAGVV